MVVPLQVQNEAVVAAAEALVAQFEASGVDVLLDDRDARPGVKFKDADLIGVPLRVVVGERGVKEGPIEVKWRSADAAHHVPSATAGEAILAELATARTAEDDRRVARREARASTQGRGA